MDDAKTELRRALVRKLADQINETIMAAAEQLGTVDDIVFILNIYSVGSQNGDVCSNLSSQSMVADLMEHTANDLRERKPNEH